MIYLDYAASTPMSDNALQTYVEASRSFFGNSQSLHDAGTASASLLETCREQMASFLNGEKEGVYFTSGGTESNYLGLHSLITAHRHQGNHIITTEIEHASIANYFYELEKDGYEVTYLPVDSYGRISLEKLENAINERTILASIQHVNSEIGTIQPLLEIGVLLKKHNILFHSDCVQSFGKIIIDVRKLNIDSLSLSSHKFYGPKGVGVCYINPTRTWKPLFTGTVHEKGFRPGTVPVPAIAAAITAAKDILHTLIGEQHRMKELRKLFKDNIQKGISIEGDSEHILPNIIGISLPHVEGQYAMLECNRHDIMISTGSACAIGKQTPSVAMTAIGKSDQAAKSFIRLSLGKETTPDHIEKVIHVLHNLT